MGREPARAVAEATATNRAVLPETGEGFAQHIPIEDADNPMRFDMPMPYELFAEAIDTTMTRWLSEHAGAKLRLLGVVLTDLSPAAQLGLFEDTPPHTTRLDAALDGARARFGVQALRRGSTTK